MVKELSQDLMTQERGYSCEQRLFFFLNSLCLMIFMVSFSIKVYVVLVMYYCGCFGCNFSGEAICVDAHELFVFI